MSPASIRINIYSSLISLDKMLEINPTSTFVKQIFAFKWLFKIL